MQASSGADDRSKSDVERLHELGYAQELKRGMSGFSNFAVSFTIISILSGCLTLFGFGMAIGGPISSSYGWLLVGIMVTFVGLAMGEVCSSYPTAGGLYYWSAKLAKRNGAAWSWFTGWFNMLGQVAITAGIDFGLAAIVSGFLNVAFEVETTKLILIGIYSTVLVLHGILNTFGVRLVALFNDISVWWHVFGVAIVVLVLVLVPDQHTSFSSLFSWSDSSQALTVDGTAATGGFVNYSGFSTSPVPFLGITAYIFLIGLLLAQYTITGYDASAHMTEETHDAAVSGPRGIWKSIVISVVFGYILLLAVHYAVPPEGGYLDALGFQYPITANLAAPVSIFQESLGDSWAIFVLLIVIGAQFFCGMASVTANSRMIYAFSRDGAVPGHRWWHAINKRTRTPTNAIWLAAALAWLLVAPAYWYGSIVAYYAVTAIGVIGLYLAYVIPTFLRLRAKEAFHPGPWTLGAKGRIIGWIAVIWVLFVCIILCLPQFNWGDLDNDPSTANVKFIDVFNFTPIVVGGMFLVIGLWYALSARKWFTGPVVQGSAEELAAIEAELESV
ncbi:MAG: amino acid permease [Actinomycetota bacterium]|nr:amino acid permease [Actinomycetota bacterium]